MNETANIGHILIFSLIGGVFSLIGGLLLLGSKRSLKILHTYATPFAAGALLATVFLDLLPEGIEVSSADKVLVYTLAGVLAFFFLERFTHWFHHHHGENDDAQKNIPLIIFGDTLHNALDGVAIASGFLINVPTGIVTTIAVAAHEIPQEIADFGLLIARGMSRKRVVLVNVLSAFATVVTACVVFLLGETEKLPLGLFLGVSAGFLLYIAASDILPSIHEHNRAKKILDIPALLVLLGVAVVWGSIALSHEFIHDHDDSHSEDSSQCVHYLDVSGNEIHEDHCNDEEH